MRVLILGATGLIGRALLLRLRRDGHEVIAHARSAARARSLLGREAELLVADPGTDAFADALGRADAVVNLAGQPLVGARWSASLRKALYQSRVGVTTALVDAMLATPAVPGVLVSVSAVGYYGDRGDEQLSEHDPPGTDFLAHMCRDWEEAARRAGEAGVRVVLPRLGVVLAEEGGALDKMLPAFRLGLGGPLGSGHQYVPWVHLDDVIEVITTALRDARYEGPINLTAPNPVPQRELAHALGHALKRPAIARVPRLVLRAIFGEAASVLLSSQRALPRRLLELGYRFRHAELDEALASVLDVDPAIHVEPAPTESSSDYLANHPALHQLTQATTIDAPIDRLFEFFSRPENLGLLTPAKMAFRIIEQPGTMTAGARMSYRLRIAGLALRWTSAIESWDPDHRFVDVQERGPYATWWHEHRFERSGSSTRMEDRVLYRAPLGALGRLANRLFIAPALRRIFSYRAAAIRRRFGPLPLAV